MTSRLAWYRRRLAHMSAGELGWRAADRVRREALLRRGPRGVPPGSWALSDGPRPAPTLSAGVDLSTMDGAERSALVTTAEELLAGRAEVLGARRDDLARPTWALDPVTGQAYPSDRPAWRIDYRSGETGRGVKQVWELSRLHHLTLLSCAWRCTNDDRYASMVATQLRSWWKANPVARGVNWSSGIELGIRLVSFVWIRRLLDGWAGAPGLFEDNDEFARQLYWHQRHLASFRSRGSSANNHVIAEAAGLLVASCAFPWFRESRRWRLGSLALLHRELARNTFEDSIDREQAFDYHGLVCELGIVAAAEAEASGLPPPSAMWTLLCGMVDVVAATVDRAGAAPRSGDGDDGRALVVTDPGANRWSSILATGAALFGRLPWWPATSPDALSMLVGGLVGRTVTVGSRPDRRPSSFRGAGLTILRSGPGAPEELWCRCDGGPQGLLPLAAHGHADALSIEVRHDGVEILSDPGTYCYHGDPCWRSYFRSTLAHNTIEVDGEDQSVAGGPFLWSAAAPTATLAVSLPAAGVQSWSAEHRGYGRLRPPLTHRRTVTLDPEASALVVSDELDSAGAHAVRLAFHLGPSVEVELDGSQASLRWTSPGGGARHAQLLLPDALAWEAFRGCTDPVLGWYSPRFGVKVPTTSLVGTAHLSAASLRSELAISPGSDEVPGVAYATPLVAP